jgi:type IV pilus assembly protein PilB
MVSSAQDNLVEILLRQGAIGKEVADKVSLENLNTGKDVEQIVLEHNFVSDEQLAKAKAEKLKVPYVDLAELGVSPEALNFIPKVVAEKYVLIPFAYDKEKNELSVAMAEPSDLAAIEFIEKKSGCKIKPLTSTRKKIEIAIDQRYAQSLSTEVTAALKETTIAPEARMTVDVAKLGEIIREAPIAKIVATILEFAVKARASDVHIEPQEDKTRIRYRIDGILHEKLVLPKKVHEAVISRIKILANMKIDEKRLPQDGRFTFKIGEHEVDLRISSLPTTQGEKIVMRLLKKTGGVPDLPQLGLRGMALQVLQSSILRPHGIIIICGPTGSGKTTTLYAILSKINTTRVNIVTLEDPVEYWIPGINQVQVNPAAGLTFASGLRSFLRQDPNIIMVGEVRDKETTDLAIQASLTGHLVFSTLHTNNASGALPRLLDMGAEPFLLASSITCIVSQRVCRRVCQNCKEEYEPALEVVEDIKKVLGPLLKLEPSKKLTLTKGKGCVICNDTGYQDRIGVFEVMAVTEKIGRLILERVAASAIEKQAVEEGMITLKQDGYLKAVEKITTIEEVIRVAQD